MPLPQLADDLTDVVDAMLARLRAVAGDLGVDPKNILDTPVDNTQPDRLPAVEVYAGAFDERFADHGHPRADAADLVVVVVCKVRAAEAWRGSLSGLAHRVKVALLTDPGLVRDYPVSSVRTEPAVDAAGLVLGAATLTWSFRRTTEYPPAVPDDLATVDAEVTAVDPAGTDAHARWAVPTEGGD